MSIGVTGRMIAAWKNPVASFHAENPRGEPRMLAYAFGTCLFLTFGRIGAEVVRPAATEGLDGIAWLATQFIAGFSFLPLALYAASALIGLTCKMASGAGSWTETRLAFFWSGFAAGPVALAAQMIVTSMISTQMGSAAAGLVWLILLTPMLATAHGFRLAKVAGFIFVVSAFSFALQAFG